jgi:hypothetical protein
MCEQTINSFNKSDLINRSEKREKSAPVSIKRMKNMRDIEDKKAVLQFERDNEL